MKEQKARALFLDRDGVINPLFERLDGQERAPWKIEEWSLLPGVIEAIYYFKDLGFKIFVVTNQPDLKAGDLKHEILEYFHTDLLKKAPIDAIEYCPHKDEDACLCRKPKPGMIFKLANQFNVDLDRSYLVGDRWRDLDAGKAAGCKTVFVRRGREFSLPADFEVDTLLEFKNLYNNKLK